jgi:hypothetical protein
MDARNSYTGENPMENDKSLSTYNTPYKCDTLLKTVIDDMFVRK